MVYFIYTEFIGNSLATALNMNLNPNFTYGIFIADPDFFFINPLPLYFPRTFLNIPKHAGSMIISIKVSQHLKYRCQKNLSCMIHKIFSYLSESSSLQAERNETFSKCIDRKVYQNIGCVSQWENDNVTDGSLRRCSTFEDFHDMMAEYSLVRKVS